jgi:hypothetical protein
VAKLKYSETLVTNQDSLVRFKVFMAVALFLDAAVCNLVATDIAEELTASSIRVMSDEGGSKHQQNAQHIKFTGCAV